MTLTLAYIDNAVTVHVADRRLSIKKGKTYGPDTEDAVKVDLLRGTVLISYAGRSMVAGVSTPRWLETQLVDSTLELRETLGAIAARLTGLFQGQAYKDHLLVVTITGWALGDEGLTPFVGTITNQDPTTLARLPTFRGVAAPLLQATSGVGGWIATGRISPAGHAAVDRWVKTVLARGATAVSVANVFAYQIRREAAIDRDRTIGKNLRAAILPVSVLEWALRTGASDYTIGYQSEGHYVLGQPMVVDLPEGQRMYAIDPAELRRVDDAPA